jgi:circadian clock protein KaiC
VLAGGLARGCLFLLEGNPGTGKTTIALHFLLQGLSTGERGLYVTLSETRGELIRSAASHGWDLDHVEIFELTPPDGALDPDQQQTLLYSSDLELGETIKQILNSVERVDPTVIVLDSLSEIRLLAQNSLRYRRQLLALKHLLARRGATVLMLDDLTSEALDKTAHSIAHGVIRLEELAPDYGGERRRLKVMKYRGQGYRGGFHDFTIVKGGVVVFPRLVASEHRGDFPRDPVKSGVSEVDMLLGGGVDKGTSTVVIGPSGVGKTIFVLQYAAAAMRRGEKVAMFLFDEEMGVLLGRAKFLGIDLGQFRADGLLFLNQVDAAELSPGQFAHRVQASVKTGVSMVILDSLNGYRSSMPEEHSLILHLHELLQYLNRNSVTTFVTVAQHGLIGDMDTPVDITYIADNVILMRYFEAQGRVRRALSVVKKRTGHHEDTIREFQITRGGPVVGPVLHELHGVLRGAPTFAGSPTQILED